MKYSTPSAGQSYLGQQRPVYQESNFVPVSKARHCFYSMFGRNLTDKLKGLQAIYMHSKTSYQAEIAFHRWCKLAEETGIQELKTMAKRIRDKLDDIVSFWTFRHINNAKQESRTVHNTSIFQELFKEFRY